MHTTENNAWTGVVPMGAERNQTFMFHGDIEKGKRSVLKKLGSELDNSDIKSNDFQHMGMNGFKKVVEETSKSYKSTKFCLIVEGSTPTSRRLFDALASGCTPILI